MPLSERERFAQDVDTLAERIEARQREFKARGEFADVQDEISGLAERHRALRGKLDAAHGPAWEDNKRRLAEEHGALYNDFIHWEERVDAKVMRGEERKREPGAKSGLV